MILPQKVSQNTFLPPVATCALHHLDFPPRKFLFSISMSCQKMCTLTGFFSLYKPELWDRSRPSRYALLRIGNETPRFESPSRLPNPLNEAKSLFIHSAFSLFPPAVLASRPSPRKPQIPFGRRHQPAAPPPAVLCKPSVFKIPRTNGTVVSI